MLLLPQLGLWDWQERQRCHHLLQLVVTMQMV
jgi:hypothetical protein